MTAPVSRISPVPLHVQIRQAIQTEVRDGLYPPGAQLPSEHEYAERFQVSLAPVRQALTDLAKSGVLVRMKGRGTFVREARLEEEFDLLRSFSDNLRERRVEFEIRVLRLATARPPLDVASALDLPPRGSAVVLRRLAIISEPAVILESYLPMPRFAAVTSLSFDGTVSLWRTLEERFGLTLGRSRSTVEVARLTDEEAELLLESPGTPALLMRSVTEDSLGSVVEVSRTLYRADRFRFAVTSHR